MKKSELEALAIKAGWREEFIEGNGVDAYVWISPDNRTYSELPRMADLKPCPFCGQPPEYTDRSKTEQVADFIAAHCVPLRTPLSVLGSPLMRFGGVPLSSWSRPRRWPTSCAAFT